jgi:hypothetical protein
MGSGFDDWIYWHIFTITVNYYIYSSQSILIAEVSLHFASRSTTDYKQRQRQSHIATEVSQSVSLGVRSCSLFEVRD